MNLLLDTHTFIWWDSSPERIPVQAFNALSNKSNTLFLSVASVWEMQIKIQLGKLDIREPLKQSIERQQSANGLKLLPVNVSHIWTLDLIPRLHRDPFDRLLIAQAMTEKFVIISGDELVSQYDVSVLWHTF